MNSRSTATAVASHRVATSSVPSGSTIQRSSSPGATVEPSHPEPVTVVRPLTVAVRTSGAGTENPTPVRPVVDLGTLCTRPLLRMTLDRLTKRLRTHSVPSLNDISLSIAELVRAPALEEVMMSNPFTGEKFGARRGGGPDGWPGAQVWEAMEQLRGQFERKSGPRMGRGDVRAAVLALLAEQPMHGYQIIHEIEERSAGAWKPSPGSVYPTLQLLADEGLITAEESNGRKTYSLAPEGRAAADAAAGKSAPWETQSPKEGTRHSALPKAGIELAQAAAQVGRSGTPEQVRAGGGRAR